MGPGLLQPWASPRGLGTLQARSPGPAGAISASPTPVSSGRPAPNRPEQPPEVAELPRLARASLLGPSAHGPGSGSLSRGCSLPPWVAGHGWIIQNNSLLAGSRRGRGDSHSKPLFFSLTSLPS